MKQIDNTLDVLEYLAARGQMKLAEAASELGVSRPTAYRLLTKLHSRGYVDHVREEHTYRLGPAIRSLAARSELSSMTRLGAPALADLRSSTGETVNLAVLRRDRIMYAAILDGFHALRMSAHIGQEVPPHATALGKAIVSMMAPDEREALLGPSPYRKYTVNTITDRRTLEQELAVTRSRGYAIDREEMDMGAVCIAAPIVGGDGKPIAAISVSAVAARFPEAEWATVGRAVKRWTERISDGLGIPELPDSGKADKA